MNRRQFAKLATATLASMTLPNFLKAGSDAAKHYLPKIGLQLYTVRNQMESDIPGTLKAIKEAGYAQVELGDVRASADTYKAAQDAGLNATSAFVDWNDASHPEKSTAATHQAIVNAARELGMKYVVFGYIGKGYRETEEAMLINARKANDLGQRCRDAGLKLSYHNHSFEYALLKDSSKTGWDLLIEATNPDYLQFELDVFWAALGGYDPLAEMDRLSGRIDQLHLKDLKEGVPTIYDEAEVPHDAFKELGNGKLDMAKIMAKGIEIGVDQCHVEQDQSPSPLESIVTSANHLRSLAE